MGKVYCEYCGTYANNVRSLSSGKCLRHPDGPFKGFHKVYEGSEKTQYCCKYCGTTFSNIKSLTSNKCLKHPDGPFKGKHSPAL